ncbi:MAG: ABC transporter permease subunit [Desulfurococcus sp.]|nr:ABC transporter permease subunit [Desulfurococcus sp.]
MARRLRFILDRLMLTLVAAAGSLGLLVLFSLLYSTVVKGLPVLLERGVSFLTDLPPTPLEEGGGIAPALVGTLLSSSIAVALAVVLAFFTSFFTREYMFSKTSKLIESVIRAYNGIPTIIVSMFVYMVIVVWMRRPSILAGAIALFIAVLPTAHYYLSTALRSVEERYREAALSLGFKRIHVFRYIYLGIAGKQIASGVLVTFIRAIGETAPLLFTIGFLTNAVFKGIDQPGNAISLLIFNYARTPYRSYHEVAWAATLVLMVIVLIAALIIEVSMREVRK